MLTAFISHQDTDLEIHVLQNLMTLAENKVIQVKPCWVGLGTEKGDHPHPLMQTPISVCLFVFLSFFNNRQVSKRDLKRKKEMSEVLRIFGGAVPNSFYHFKLPMNSKKALVHFWYLER